MITLENAVEVLSTDKVLDLRYVYSWASNKYWVVLKDIDVRLSPQYDNLVITIPRGFCTDLSSVPRKLWGIFPPFGDFLLAALIHDYLYVQNIGTQAKADMEMFIWSNVIQPTKPWDNILRYYGVRIGGKSWWNKSKLNPDLVLMDIDG